jgi:hypothetical protein
VQRQLRTVLVLLLLAGTAVAFVVTEDLKLESDPIARPRITASFSPVCRCEQQTARIGFRLRREDRLTLEIADEEGRIVRTILREARFGPGDHEFGWDGRDGQGAVVKEGPYRARVELAALDRVIEFPRPIVVDMTPAKIATVRVRPLVISPDRDRRSDATIIRYRVSERAQALLLVNGRQEVKTRMRGSGALIWPPVSGRRRGVYELTLSALDAAGNRSRPTAPVALTVRYVALNVDRIRVRPRRMFSVGVSTDARRYRWRLGRRRGSARARLLRLRAPARPGLYPLVVEVSGRRDSAVVAVRRAR